MVIIRTIATEEFDDRQTIDKQTTDYDVDRQAQYLGALFRRVKLSLPVVTSHPTNTEFNDDLQW